jgi:hypothetical protein
MVLRTAFKNILSQARSQRPPGNSKIKIARPTKDF